MPVLLVLGLLAATTIVGVAPAGAVSCHFVDGTHVDSGVSSATVWLDHCSDGGYRVSGTLYDDACDDRTAYLDVYSSSGRVDTVQVTGCGNSTPYTFTYAPDLADVSLRTKARNHHTAGPTAWSHLAT